ncbi:AraC family transcriptional regulator [Spongiibacter sp.]|uniref:AraC family transcriptional regulator n=1 Tax=Spongiibacter sp. TaxID=2024860 RepID=UPI000C695003|nr:AraC family transcriptional regulator [Spongiibacter sp.]MBU73319.1 hypothetical protein [Spongiibacter sp.]
MEFFSKLSTAPPRHFIYGLIPLVTALRKKEIDVDAILMSSGIPKNAMDDPAYQLTPQQELIFTENAISALNNPALGLYIGSKYHLSTYGVLGLAIMTSDNMLEGMKTLYQYMLMTWTYMHWRTTVSGNTAYVGLEKLRDLGGCYQYMIDRGLVAHHTIFREALGKPFPVKELRLMQAKPEYAEEYERYFQCPILYEADENCYAFDSALLSEPLAQSEAETARIYARQCEILSSQLTGNYTFSDLVRNLILRSPTERYTLDRIADRLGLTRRTVQRKLKMERCTYKDILEDVRKNLAIEYLQTTRFPLEDIAVRLGYSDASSFSHAYKRWTGESPSYLREKSLASSRLADVKL